LFGGLWIEKSGYKFDKHPVLNFTMTYDLISTQDDLVNRLKRNLKKLAFSQGVQLTSDFTAGEMLEDLLEGIYKKHGVAAVILVDEYDFPVTRHISDQKLASANRKVLHDFYMSMKTNKKYIRFAFVTGITGFAMKSIGLWSEQLQGHLAFS
jgi:hypothetical protein